MTVRPREWSIAKGVCRLRGQISMAASTVGRMEPFDPNNESIVAYLERMQLYFEGNGIKAEKQVPVSSILSVGRTTGC